MNFKNAKYNPHKVDHQVTSSRLATMISLKDILIDKLGQIFWTFEFCLFELCCLCKGFSRYLKDIFKDLH